MSDGEKDKLLDLGTAKLDENLLVEDVENSDRIDLDKFLEARFAADDYSRDSMNIAVSQSSAFRSQGGSIYSESEKLKHTS